MRAAFLENLSDDAIILQPTPVPARAAWQATPESKDKLPDLLAKRKDSRFQNDVHLAMEKRGWGEKV